MSEKKTLEQTFDEIEYHIQCMDERGLFPNVWISMIYLDENYSHIREYWNHPIFDKEYWNQIPTKENTKSTVPVPK